MQQHPASFSVDRLIQDCDLTRTRRSGPGGQHRNKVETGIEITHRPTGIKTESCEKRSQEQNRQTAIRRLRLKLALEFRCPERAPELPTSFWTKRFPAGKLKISVNHEDYPTALAEALDVLFENGMEFRESAEQLGCSSSQLAHLLKQEPKAVHLVNQKRQELGFHLIK